MEGSRGWLKSCMFLGKNSICARDSRSRTEWDSFGGQQGVQHDWITSCDGGQDEDVWPGFLTSMPWYMKKINKNYLNEQTDNNAKMRVNFKLRFYSVNLLLSLNWHSMLKSDLAVDLANQGLNMFLSKYWVGIRYNGPIRIIVISI